MSPVPPRSTTANLRGRFCAGGFTLIELMVSLAIVVLLVLGVNRIFGIASQTVGAGNAISTAQRNNLTGHTVFHEDLNGAVTFNAPFFIIRSESTAAFRNAADELADRDYDRSQTSLPDVDEAIRTADWNADGTEDRGTEITPRTAMDARVHRVDQLCFFARGLFPRQTGNDQEFVSDMSSSEALIWYGHLTHARGPDISASDKSGDPRNPGIRPVKSSDPPETAVSNPNNFYASSWNLGRVAMVLREPDITNKDEFTRPENASEPPNFIGYTGNGNLAPLEFGSGARYSSRMPAPANSSILFPIQSARFDLAGTSIDSYRRILRTAFDSNAANDWYLRLCYRFDNYQFPLRPLTSAAAARTVPAILPNCTQFAVEFAGDFVTQDPSTGRVIATTPDPDGFATPAPDGIIDYIVVEDPPRTVGGQPVLNTKIRWYGYPRDTGGPNGGGPDGVVAGNIPGHLNPDVVPLRDIELNRRAFRFEKDVNDGAVGIPNQADYTTPGAIPFQGRYLCAWGPEPAAVTVLPPLPKLIRITIGLDDPQGRMAAQQVSEYVIELH